MPIIDVNNTQSQMRKGTLDFAVLLIISQGAIYSSDILSELEKSDLIVGEGTLYPLLSRLKSGGLLKYEWQESTGGPPRKYYSLTPAGTQLLVQLTQNWHKLEKSLTKLIKQAKIGDFV